MATGVAPVENTAWVLNLDAEHELADPTGYQTPTRVAKKIRTLASALPGLIGQSDIVFETNSRQNASGCIGQAWCPTPRALAALKAMGAQVPDAPRLEVLQRVNHRGFQQTLQNTKQSKPGSGRLVLALDSAIKTIESPSPHSVWVAKRPFGFAGRGQRRLTRQLSSEDYSWIQSSMAQGHGLWLEHFLSIEHEFSLHGMLSPRGALTIGKPVAQRCDRSGRWQSSHPADDALTSTEMKCLGDSLERTGEALASAGYFGPFGVDACRFTNAVGSCNFEPLLEINARFTMGFGYSGLNANSTRMPKTPDDRSSLPSQSPSK